MDASETMALVKIEEIKILHDVRLVFRHDLNPVYSKNNLQVQFQINGDLKGAVTCYLCLDGHELSQTEKNYIYPLFVESMNILIGKQISQDKALSNYNIKLSPPKLSMNAKEINTSYKALVQKYELELQNLIFSILTEYSLEAMN